MRLEFRGAHEPPPGNGNASLLQSTSEIQFSIEGAYLIGTSMQSTRWRVMLSVIVAMTTWAGPLKSQEWPQRPVKIVVPYAPGGNSDGIGRVIARDLAAAFGQPFVVENRPGASGAIA